MSDLRDELRALGAERAWPPTPDLATAIAPRLAPRRRGAAWRPAVVLPALLAVLVAFVAVVPPARTAVLEFLGLAGGEQVVRVPTTPTAPQPTLAPGRGAKVSLAQARAAVGFPVRVPRALGPPPEVRLDRSLAGGAVSLVYGDRAVLTAFRGRSLPFARKFVGPKTKVSTTRIAGHRAIFLSGAPTQWVALDEHGKPIARTGRLVGANVLLFETGGVAYRLETGAGLTRAREIAASLRDR